MGGTQKIRDSMNSVVVENSIPFRRHNSCVDFTFLPELFATNSRKFHYTLYSRKLHRRRHYVGSFLFGINVVSKENSTEKKVQIWQTKNTSVLISLSIPSRKRKNRADFSAPINGIKNSCLNTTKYILYFF